MQRILRIIAGNLHTAAIDKTIDLERCFELFHLLQNLLHLSLCQRKIIQSIYTSVIFKQDIGPILQELGFILIFQNAGLPLSFGQLGNKSLFKIFFITECHAFLTSVSA